MPYKNLKQCILDLERNGHLIRVKEEVDPYLEMAEIQRRVYAAEGPAIFFEHVKGCDFPAVSNLFGTLDRCRFMFRDTLQDVQKIIELKADPTAALKKPFRYAGLPLAGLHALPKRARRGPVLFAETTVDRLPQIQSWPDDGGPFITLPQVYTEDAEKPGVMQSNLGMYRVQLGGNDYVPGKEVGLHYQIHRGIGVHHSKAIKLGRRFPVSIFVGGPPAHTFSAVMPLPEGISELVFAGALAGRRFRVIKKGDFVISADADFCIAGYIDLEKLKPEGPFGDHLGYYSLAHNFPFLKVEKVYHRKDAIWPFTVVGRPPQEDTSFGELIHEITGPLVPKEIPGLRAMHAVDAAGVHPLMLAIGSERYVPFEKREPQEILTIANAILGFGQASLAKYLCIVAHEDRPDLDIHDVEGFLGHLLERVDWTRDLHFQTRTTIDTLDYSGEALNRGSKVVMAAAGEVKRRLSNEVPSGVDLPPGFDEPKLVRQGILAVSAPGFSDYAAAEREMDDLCARLEQTDLSGLPLVVVADDARFVAGSLRNFLWVTFTRSNPSHDIYGVGLFYEHKHWGCRGPLVIDARIKPHHAPPLIEDPEVTKRVDALSLPGKSLHGII